MSSEPSPESRASLEFAERNALIAHKLLTYSPEGTQEAALHILRGWRGVAAIFNPQAGALDPGTVLAQGHPLLPRSLNTRECKEWIEQAAKCKPGENVAFDADELRHQCSQLLSATRRIRRELYTDSGGGCLRPPAAFIWCLAFAAIAGAVWASIRMLTPMPPWRAAFYSNGGLVGAPFAVTEFNRLDFDWTTAPPLPSLRDLYSARFDTCIRLPERQRLNLELGSDDGSKMFIDGEEVISMWKQQGLSKQVFSRELPEGGHHVRIEYFQAGGAALLILKGSLGTTPLGEIPASMLTAPRFWTDDTVTCN